MAWPAGNSGSVGFFAPQNGINGTLGIKLENSTEGNPLNGIYEKVEGSDNPVVGVSTLITFNSSATMTVAILGSIRTMRDFIEGPSILIPEIQDAIEYSKTDNGVSLSRLWLDNVTTTDFNFETVKGKDGKITVTDKKVDFEAGTYRFSSSFNYPQLEQLGPKEVLKESAHSLIEKFPDQTISLSFLSYTSKLLAGAWRFLTYFGRDSMISMLLLQPILSEGEGSAIEAVIGAVLDRINKTDGSAAHEETLGDYSTYLAFKKNETSTEPQYDYKMIDTDFFLPVVGLTLVALSFFSLTSILDSEILPRRLCRW